MVGGEAVAGFGVGSWLCLGRFGFLSSELIQQKGISVSKVTESQNTPFEEKKTLRRLLPCLPRRPPLSRLAQPAAAPGARTLRLGSRTQTAPQCGGPTPRHGPVTRRPPA